VAHHVEVIGAHDVQQPAVQLAQRGYDAVADARSRLEAEPAIEQALHPLGRFWVGVARMRLGRQSVQQPEERAQCEIFRIHEFLDPKLLARLGHAGHDAAVVDSRTIRHRCVEELDPFGRELQHRSLVPFDLAEVFPDGVAAIEPDPAQHTRSKAIEWALVAPDAIVEARDHRDRLRRGQDRAPALPGRCERADDEQQRLALDGHEMVCERCAVVRRIHRDGRPGQPGDALSRAASGDRYPGSQQHAYVEPARRVADEMKFPRPEAAARDYLPAQRVRAPWDRSRRLRRAGHDSGLDAVSPERAGEHLLHVLEVAHRADRSETEESRHQEDESLGHDQILTVGPRCATAPTGRGPIVRIHTWTLERDHRPLPSPGARARDASTLHHKEKPMNWDRIEGNWKQVTGRAKVQWGKLTDDDLDVVAGRRDQLAGKIQERYGIAKDEAEKQLSAWESKADDSWFS